MERPNHFESERQFANYVIDRLTQAGFKVFQDYNFVEAGFRVDALVVTEEDVRVVLEFKILSDVSGLIGALNQLQRFQQASDQIDLVYVVAPFKVGLETHPLIVDTDLLIGKLQGDISELLAKDKIISRPPLKKVAKAIIFAAMPFAEQFSDTFAIGIAGAAAQIGAVADRADHDAEPNKTIIENIHNKIRDADILVADLTDSNANVIYELGYGMALEKPCIRISATPPEQLPFDVRSHSVYVYTMGNVTKLKEYLADELAKHL